MKATAREPRYEIEVFSQSKREVYLSTSRLEALRTAAAWYSRKVKVTVTDLKLKQVIYPVAEVSTK